MLPCILVNKDFHCATAEIKQFRRLETEFVLPFYLSFISSVWAPLVRIASVTDGTRQSFDDGACN